MGVICPSFSLPDYQLFDGGLEVISVGTPAATASAYSLSRVIGDEYRMEYK